MATIHDFWGKTDRTNPYEYHPLVYHMIDVLSMVEAIWDGYLKNTVKDEMSNALELSIEDSRAWVAFLGALHDIGKASPGFQFKSPMLARRLVQSGYDFVPACEDHRIMTAYFIRDIFLNGKYGAPKLDCHSRAIMLHSLGGHHGSFVDSTSLAKIRTSDAGNGPWEETREKIVESIMKLVNLESHGIPKINKSLGTQFFMLLSGMVVVADWIASSEEFFPYVSVEREPDDYYSYSKEQALAALKHLNWSLPGVTTNRGFMDTFSFIKHPFPVQEIVDSLSESLAKAGLVIIEAPMGEGKTEAALFLAERMNAEMKADSAYIALPTQATSNQIFRRVRAYLEHRKTNYKINLALIHGQAMLSEEYQQLRVKPSRGEDAEGNLVANEWFTYKKRGLLSPYGVGTIDQALLSVLPVKHFFVRLFGLAGKVVVLDEVHAYDVYMSTLLDRLLTWLSALGSKVIILSATLPRKRREELVEAYAGRSIQKHAPYPRISWVSDTCMDVMGFRSASESEHGRPSYINLRFIEPSLEVISDRILEATGNGGRVAVLCNTVKTAQETYQYLKERCTRNDIELDLLHARYPFGLRQIKENNVLERYGSKERNPDERRVLISTQIIEQSLDLDFDLMISEMAPVDLLIQRSGRIHRHNLERPRGLEDPTLLVIEPDFDEEHIPRFGASEFIYSRYVLLKSYLAIKERSGIEIPQGIEKLIEIVYDGEMEVPENLRKEMKRALGEWDKDVDKCKREAETRIIGNPDSDRPWEMKDILLKEEDPETHRMLQALTRLTPPTVSVVCLFECENGLGTDPEGGEIIDLNALPDKATTRLLLNNALSISNPWIVKYLGESDKVPNAWRNSSLLRHHRPIVFKRDDTPGDYVSQFGEKCIIFNKEIGIQVEGVGE